MEIFYKPNALNKRINIKNQMAKDWPAYLGGEK